MRPSQAWFEATAPDGDVIWKKLGKKNLKLVLAHPNSWDLDQQAILKRAVIRSGVIAAEAVECARTTLHLWGFS